ncbi:MAG: phage holin family protein [Verrucomicrobiaceae bacterium]|nr:MAG: phage holin family protein [Verrucomicrobiaceae bacterium]
MITDENSVAGLLKQLRDDTTALVREEIALAKTEAAEKVAKFSRNAVLLAVGALLGYTALIPLLVGLGFALGSLFVSLGMGTNMGAFLGFLVVALITGGISAAIVLSALNSFKKEKLTPDRTIGTLKDDKQWIQSKIS